MTITLDIRPEIEAELNATARAQGLSAAQYAGRVLEQALAATPMPADKKSDTRPIWDVISANMASVPPEDFARLPTDGASEVDHYLYGHPKRNA